MVQLLIHSADSEFQLSTTLLLKTNFLVSKRNLLNSFFSWPLLEIAPVLLLVLDRAGPELDRIGAGPIFGPAPGPLFAFLHCDNVETVKP